MQPIARFIVRGSDKEDGLFIGAKLKTKESEQFKSGDIWEISECLGELILKRIGKSHLNKEYWNNDIDNVLLEQGKYLFLTDKEYRNLK